MTSAGRTGGRTGPVDCCLHHNWARPEDLVECLPRAWQEQVTGPSLRGRRTLLPYFVPKSPYEHPDGRFRPEAMPAGGMTYEEVRDRYLDPAGIERAVLCHVDGLLIPAMPSHYLALEMTRAANRWSASRWLESEDERLYGSILVPSHLPEEGAAEIARWAQHPRMAQAVLCGNGLGKPFGHPVYHPMYAAAAEASLPVVVHAGGDVLAGSASHPAAGGLPAFFSETSALAAQSLMTHVSSLIVQGVFQKWPDLRVLVVGGGTAWISWLVWRLDMEYRAKRREVPWLRDLPSDVFREHVRVATYPLERPRGRGDLARLLAGTGDLERVLCFASGYPHWDSDDPRDVAARLPEGWVDRVMRCNAIELHGWDDRAAAAEPLGKASVP